MMGRPNLSTFQAFTVPSYYPTLIINFGIALIVAFAVKKITMQLDRKHDWYHDIWRRALLQFVFGVMAVSILSFFLVWMYFHAFKQDIVESGYLDYELPFSIALITILNFYYVAYYFYMYPREPQKVTVSDHLNSTTDIPEDDDVITFSDKIDRYRSVSQRSQIKPNEPTSRVKENKEIIIIDTPVRSIPVKVKDVTMFFIYNKVTFVRQKEMKGLNECLQCSLSLSEIMEILDEQTFFRINRKCILNFNAIDSFRLSGGKNLLLNLKENNMEHIEKQEWEKLTTVSGDKAADFKKWMDR